jgi:hypothetical protein
VVKGQLGGTAVGVGMTEDGWRRLVDAQLSCPMAGEVLIDGGGLAYDTRIRVTGGSLTGVSIVESWPAGVSVALDLAGDRWTVDVRAGAGNLSANAAPLYGEACR